VPELVWQDLPRVARGRRPVECFECCREFEVGLATELGWRFEPYWKAVPRVRVVVRLKLPVLGGYEGQSPEGRTPTVYSKV